MIFKIFKSKTPYYTSLLIFVDLLPFLKILKTNKDQQTGRPSRSFWRVMGIYGGGWAVERPMERI